MNGFPSCETQHRERTVGGLKCRPLYSDTVGDTIKTHSHNKDHVTIVTMGKSRVTGYYPMPNDVLKRSDEIAYVVELSSDSDPFLIEKHIHHSAEVLEAPYRQWCIFVQRYSDGTPSGVDVGNGHAEC